MEEETTKLTYDPALDGLRGAAVLAVLLSHFDSRLILGGQIGVHLFFVLSGYLISRILASELDSVGTIDLRRFYWHRFLRLMPPLWTMLLAFLPMILLGQHREPQLESWLMTAAYLMNFNAAFGWMSVQAFTHTWTLAAEQQFYLLWPTVLLLGARYRPRLFLSVLLIAAILWRAYLNLHGAPGDRIYYAPDTASDAILIGCILGFSYIPLNLSRVIAAAWPVWLPAMATAILLAAKSIFLIDLVALLGGLLIISTPNPGLRTILTAGPLRFTGQISYALYLWHLPLIVFMQTRWLLSGWQLLIPVACAFSIATLSYFTVEAYSRKLKNVRPRTIAPGM